MARTRGGGRSTFSSRFSASGRTSKSGDVEVEAAMALPRIRMVAVLGKSKMRNVFASSKRRTSVIRASTVASCAIFRDRVDDRGRVHAPGFADGRREAHDQRCARGGEEEGQGPGDDPRDDSHGGYLAATSSSPGRSVKSPEGVKQ